MKTATCVAPTHLRMHSGDDIGDVHRFTCGAVLGLMRKLIPSMQHLVDDEYIYDVYSVPIEYLLFTVYNEMANGVQCAAFIVHDICSNTRHLLDNALPTDVTIREIRFIDIGAAFIVISSASSISVRHICSMLQRKDLCAYSVTSVWKFKRVMSRLMHNKGL